MSYIILNWFTLLSVIVTFTIFGAWLNAECEHIISQRSLNEYKTYINLLNRTETPAPRSFRDEETKS